MVRFLIDVNLPKHLPIWVSSQYLYVHNLGPDWKDSEIWQYATVHKLTIVTKDADFSERVLFSNAGPSVIHFRFGNLRVRELEAYLAAQWTEIARLSQSARLVHVYRDRIECIE